MAKKCKHFSVCEMSTYIDEADTCYLHYSGSSKDKERFRNAFHAHRQRLRQRRNIAKREQGGAYDYSWQFRDDFQGIVFPDGFEFRDKDFPKEGVSFINCEFRSVVNLANRSNSQDASKQLVLSSETVFISTIAPSTLLWFYSDPHLMVWQIFVVLDSKVSVLFQARPRS